MEIWRNSIIGFFFQYEGVVVTSSIEKVVADFKDEPMIDVSLRGEKQMKKSNLSHYDVLLAGGEKQYNYTWVRVNSYVE